MLLCASLCFSVRLCASLCFSVLLCASPIGNGLAMSLCFRTLSSERRCSAQINPTSSQVTTCSWGNGYKRAQCSTCPHTSCLQNAPTCTMLHCSRPPGQIKSCNAIRTRSAGKIGGCAGATNMTPLRETHSFQIGVDSVRNMAEQRDNGMIWVQHPICPIALCETQCHTIRVWLVLLCFVLLVALLLPLLLR